MDRRQFLSRAAFFTVAPAVLGACGSGDDDDGDDGGSVPPPPVGQAAFPQSVASGDPRDSSMVFWTRCVNTGASSADLPLSLQVSTGERFETLLAQVPLVASAAHDFTVRAKVTGLPSATTLFYRFVAGSDFSPVGRTRTAPAPDAAVAQLRFAWLCCQDWSVNHWQAMSLLAAEELDFVVHVGDYVYEAVGTPAQRGRVEPAHAPIAFPDGATLSDGSRCAVTLADYRNLYRTYRGDARLQQVHTRFPMVAIWDDHEFSDDGWQDHDTYTNANRQDTPRRRAANQAWVEYMPVDFGDVSFDSANTAYDNLRLYRDFRFGALAHLVMTDERLYRDDHVVSEAALALGLGHDPVNGNDAFGARLFVQQPLLEQAERVRTLALGRPPSILGPTQTQWWKDTLKTSTAAWKLWGNAVMLNRLWADLRDVLPSPLDTVYVLAGDSWDGYPAHKAEVLGWLKSEGIRNVVALTGDLHAFQCGVVRDLPDPAVGTPVLVDLVSAGISSASLFSGVRSAVVGTPLESLAGVPEALNGLLREHNPDLLHADHDAQGYASVTLTADRLVAVFNKVKPLEADGSAPAQSLLRRTRITVTAGSLAPLVEDGV
ncbi:alkaline phosphatase D family protein [Azohydromonas australica]|uniref:alkaline phosphatase D family protein n=1 Tax=Azohydromonas australica TaxID=364039 RepID=UPI00040FD4D4|nr:alkaline phosphatase D family protein [Azohydromonas australica]